MNRIPLYLLLCLGILMAGIAAAQPYPSRPIRLIVPFPPGGVADIMARTVGAKVADNTGQPVIVDNRAGASGIVGTDTVAKANPDGYTVLLANLPVMVINELTYSNLPYNAQRDFAPVTMLADQPYIVAITTRISANTLPEFIQQARQKPGQFTFGSASASTHLAGELFKGVTGIDMLHVPYKGSAPAITDLLGGQIALLIDPVITLLPLVQSKKLKALCVTAPKRATVAPDIPSYAEYGLKGLDMTSWQGIVAPARTPPAVVNALHEQIAKALKSPEVIERMQKAGVTPLGYGADEFRAFVKMEFTTWTGVAKRMKLVPQPLGN